MDASRLIASLPLILEGAHPTRSPLGELDTVDVPVLLNEATWEADLESLGLAENTKLPPSFGFASMWARSWRVQSITSLTRHLIVPCVGLVSAGEKRKTTITNNVNRKKPEREEEVLSGPLRDMDGNLIYKTLEGGYWNPDTGQEYDITNPFISREFTDGSTSQTDQELPDPRVTLTTTYFTTRFPEPDVAGQSMDPPLDLEDPRGILESLDIPRTNEDDATVKDWNDGRLAIAAHPVRRQYLAGWVCDSRSIDPLFTDDLAADIRPIAGGRRTGVVGSSGLFAVTDVISYYPAWTIK